MKIATINKLSRFWRNENTCVITNNIFTTNKSQSALIVLRPADYYITDISLDLKYSYYHSDTKLNHKIRFI